MNYILNYNDIECIDLDISNICNLRCPLCLSNIFYKKIKKLFANINFILNKIKLFKNLKTILIAGIASEPTLHPDLFYFIEQLNKLNIKINLFTNGSTNNKIYWMKLSKYISKRSKIIFTICGTTLKLHEKYRVNSNLLNIILNALIVKNILGDDNVYIQYIRFQYNKFETDDLIFFFLKNFLNKYIINTDSIYERINLFLEKNEDEICSDIVFSNLYKTKLKNILQNRNNLNINCNSYINKVILMDPFGKIYPCAAYRIFSKIEFENNKIMDYNNIINNKCDFCFECDRQNLSFLENNNVDPFYMCSNY